jgi:hypothetical protein
MIFSGAGTGISHVKLPSGCVTERPFRGLDQRIEGVRLDDLAQGRP